MSARIADTKSEGGDPAAQRSRFLELVEQAQTLPTCDGTRRLIGTALSEAGLAGLACGAPDAADLLRQGVTLLSAPDLMDSMALARNFAHDLRNPVSALLMNGELLAEDAQLPADELQDIGTGMVRIAGRLLSAVDVLSDYRRLQSGQWTPQIEPMSVATLVDMARQQVALVADYRRVSLTFGPVSGRVMVEPEPATRALVSVLRHVIGFTIKEASLKGFERGETYVIQVVDDGLPPGAHQLALGLGGCLGRKVTGDSLNLSLAVSEMMVARMGGQLTVTSARPVGAVFEMAFPVR